MAHTIVKEAEAILDQEFRVLDHGFVRLVDYMGGDDAIVEAARVSYGDGTKTVSEDKILIDYLLRNKHTSPFEQIVLKFHVKMPIFVARQWIRHRMARLNEISGRYSVMRDEFYVPEPGAVRFQSKNNKQGRSNKEVPRELQKKVIELLRTEQETVYGNYQSLIGEGVARELARLNLPLSLYTEMYWQMDLNNLFKFLGLRIDSHAQHEIRLYAEAILKIVKVVAPAASEAFEEHILHGRNFSKTEVIALSAALEDKSVRESLNASLIDAGLRESRRVEFFKKLGLDMPRSKPKQLPGQAPLFEDAELKPAATAAD